MRKIVVQKLTPSFREGTAIVAAVLPSAPSPSQLFVRTHYVGINASDVNASAGRYTPGAKPPFEIGFEAVGVVTAVGSTAASRGYSVGCSVAVIKIGTFADVFIADTERDGVYPIDAPLPSVVPLLIGGLTSSVGLEVAGEMRSGETVLVTGASGGTGLFAVQLAKIAGNTVIGTCGSDDKKDALRRLGCDRPVNYKTEDLAAIIRAEFPKGVDLCFEGVGGRMLETCKQCMHPTSGRLVAMGFTSQYQKKDGFDTADAQLVKSRGSGAVRGFLLKDYPKLQPEHLKKLQGLVAQGKLSSVSDPKEFVGLEQIADAVEYLHAGNNIGKPVVRLCSTAEAAEYAAPAAKPVDSGPPVGSMQRGKAKIELEPGTRHHWPSRVANACCGLSRRYAPWPRCAVLEIQGDCMADDIAVEEYMVEWSEARLTAFFENGGEE